MRFALLALLAQPSATVRTSRARHARAPLSYRTRAPLLYVPPEYIDINLNPFTFSIPKNKWFRDNTPPSGMAAKLGGSVPDEASIAPKTKIPPVIDTSEEEQPSDDITTASTIAQLQISIAALQRKMASVQDSIG